MENGKAPKSTRLFDQQNFPKKKVKNKSPVGFQYPCQTMFTKYFQNTTTDCVTLVICRKFTFLFHQIVFQWSRIMVDIFMKFKFLLLQNSLLPHTKYSKNSIVPTTTQQQARLNLYANRPLATWRPCRHRCDPDDIRAHGTVGSYWFFRGPWFFSRYFWLPTRTIIEAAQLIQ